MTPDRERWLRRLMLAVSIGVSVAFFAFHAQVRISNETDFAQLWHATRGWMAGRNPYEVVGPNGSFHWPFPLLYPATAVLVTVPFAVVPLPLANAAFVGIGCGALAWVLSGAPERYRGTWWLFGSACFVYVIRTAQWSPLLMAAALAPPAGWLLACKPSIALALMAAYPRWRAALGMAAFVLVTLVLLPGWPRDWLRALPSAYHVSAPVTYLTAGGPLLLLAALRWRLPEARLLLALASIPHTTMLYEALPLFLVARRWQEGAALAAGSWLCMYRHVLPDYLQMMHTMAWRMTVFMYLPCLVMVLLRTNGCAGRCHERGSDSPPGPSPTAVRRRGEQLAPMSQANDSQQVS